MKTNISMQLIEKLWKRRRKTVLLLFVISMISVSVAQAQEEEEPTVDKPVKAIFESAVLIDNQSVDVPIKGTFEFDIQHRFGTLQNGFEDLFGLYAPSNMRMGFTYSPIENLALGFGFAKRKNLLDFSGKYALLRQSRSGKMPLSVTYYGNVTLDPREEGNREEVFNKSDRLSFFHQVIIARKVTDWLSLQVAPSLSHYNVINKYMENDHYALSFGGQVKLTSVTSIIANVDQPLTKHTLYNPNPNISLGVQFTSSSHAFQIFVANFNSLSPQENNVFNTHNYADKITENFLIGFNITRLWNW